MLRILFALVVPLAACGGITSDPGHPFTGEFDAALSCDIGAFEIAAPRAGIHYDKSLEVVVNESELWYRPGPASVSYRCLRQLARKPCLLRGRSNVWGQLCWQSRWHLQLPDEELRKRAELLRNQLRHWTGHLFTRALSDTNRSALHRRSCL